MRSKQVAALRKFLPWPTFPRYPSHLVEAPALSTVVLPGLASMAIPATPVSSHACLLDRPTLTTYPAILQTGIDWILEGGEVQYAAWYEWYPAALYDFSGFDVNPGDSVSMSVVASSLTSGTAYITNESTGQSVSKSFADQPSLCGQDVSAGLLAELRPHTNSSVQAEWIVEDFSVGGGLIPFAEFSPVTFNDASWVQNGASRGVSGSTILDIEQNGQVLTSCGTSGSSVVTCSYTG